MDSTAVVSSAGRDASRRFAWHRIFDPINLSLLPNLVLLTLARQHGVIAPEPLWLVLGALLVSHVSAVALATSFPMGTDRARPRLFLISSIGLCGLLLYVTGWGAVFAVALVGGAAVVIHTDGSRYGRIAMISIVVTIAAGEAGVALGVFKSMVRDGTAHGIALVEAMITTLVVMLVTRGQREKELAEERERVCEERFRALVQHASDAILVVEDGGRVMYASPAVEQVFGCAPELLESFDLSWIDPDHVDTMVEVWLRLRARPGATESVELPVRRTDGMSRWVEAHLSNLTDNPAVNGFVCNMRDIGERRLTQQRLLHDAQHDPLTGLANRRCFAEQLDAAWQSVPADQLLGVLFVDVDDFKQINDRHDHATGDEALLRVANLLSALVRPNDRVARVGGDEFVVLLNGVPDEQRAAEIAQRITSALCVELQINGRELAMSVSVGVATSRADAKSAEEVVREADQAMYEAKRTGGGRFLLAGSCNGLSGTAATAGTATNKLPTGVS